MKKIHILKGDDQIITFRSNGKKIASVKVFPGNDFLTFYVHPAIKKKKAKELIVKLYGSYIKFNKIKINMEKIIAINQEKEFIEIDSTRKINQLLRRGFMVYATGFINPYGPTLNMYYLDGKRKPRLLELMIHPLGFRLMEVAEVKTDKQGVIQRIEYYGAITQCMPTLFLKNEAVAENLLKEIIMAYIDEAEGVTSVYTLFKNYEGNTSQRITAEIESAIDHFKVQMERLVIGKAIDNLEAEQVDKLDFVRLLLKEANYSEELNYLYDLYINARDIGTPEKMAEFHGIYMGLIYDCGLDDTKFPRNNIYE